MNIIRKVTALILALMLAGLCAAALADDPSAYPAAKSETVAKLLQVPDFKFFVREDFFADDIIPIVLPCARLLHIAF